MVIPGATGLVYAPVRAYISVDLWNELPNKFLNSAILSNHTTESLLEALDTEHRISETIVTGYSENVSRHPVLPRNSVARKVKNGLLPVIFNILIDFYEEQMKDLFDLNVC